MNNTAELLRLIHNLIRLGTIAEVDHGAALCRVAFGDNTSGWLRWFNARAGSTRSWSPPTVGEQVAMFSPGGDPAAAVVLVGLYQSQYPAPSANPAVFFEIFPDGAEVEYNHETHELRATIPGNATVIAQGSATLTANGGATVNANTTINGNTVINGNLTASGNVAMNGSAVTHGGINIGNTHKHPGVSTGPGQTGTPI